MLRAVGSHARVLEAAFGHTCVGGACLAHGLVVRVYGRAVRLGEAHEVPPPVQRSSGGANLSGLRPAHNVQLGVFVWAANSGHLLETSIGYYLCPLCNIMLGLAVFKERLTRMQAVATALAAVGVAYFVVAHGGSIWISFALAISFSVYGAVKKKGGYPALPGMAFESLLTGALGALALAVGAIVPWIWQVTPATPDPLAIASPEIDLVLFVGCGILTAIPLLLYSAAANRVSMTVLGFLQYVSPTISLVLAVMFFGEGFTPAHAVCFGLIWLGIAVVGAEAFVLNRTRRAQAVSAALADAGE